MWNLSHGRTNKYKGNVLFLHSASIPHGRARVVNTVHNTVVRKSTANPHADVLVSGERGQRYVADETRRVVIAPRAAGDDVERVFGCFPAFHREGEVEQIRCCSDEDRWAGQDMVFLRQANLIPPALVETCQPGWSHAYCSCTWRADAGKKEGFVAGGDGWCPSTLLAPDVSAPGASSNVSDEQ